VKAADKAALLQTLRLRFEANPARHRGIEWTAVLARFGADPTPLETLLGMERTGGEPDAIGCDGRSGAIIFCDCSAESPEGRRSLCYDRAALDARKKNKPAGSALELATSLGIELLTEAQYRELQTLGEFDRKTSSWVSTPSAVRKLGGALFCDRRFGQIFVYHNGADSYYAGRGFRGRVTV